MQIQLTITPDNESERKVLDMIRTARNRPDSDGPYQEVFEHKDRITALRVLNSVDEMLRMVKV